MTNRTRTIFKYRFQNSYGLAFLWKKSVHREMICVINEHRDFSLPLQRPPPGHLNISFSEIMPWEICLCTSVGEISKYNLESF